MTAIGLNCFYDGGATTDSIHKDRVVQIAQFNHSQVLTCHVCCSPAMVESRHVRFWNGHVTKVPRAAHLTRDIRILSPLLQSMWNVFLLYIRIYRL